MDGVKQEKGMRVQEQDETHHRSVADDAAM
jgi:hypothetical protein